MRLIIVEAVPQLRQPRVLIPEVLKLDPGSGPRGYRHETAGQRVPSGWQADGAQSPDRVRAPEFCRYSPDTPMPLTRIHVHDPLVQQVPETIEGDTRVLAGS